MYLERINSRSTKQRRTKIAINENSNIVLKKFNDYDDNNEKKLEMKNDKNMKYEIV